MFYPKVYSYYPALVKITCRANCLSLVLILVFSSFVYAQSEAIIQTTSVRHAQPEPPINRSNGGTSDRSVLRANRSLQLPFFDDFSEQGQKLSSQQLWEETDKVMVNNQYPILPPTVGVATLDRHNEVGRLYDNSYGIYGDVLTSQGVDLTSNSSGTLYLSFYVQPRGLQYHICPCPSDALRLEFLACPDNGTCEWETVSMIKVSEDVTSGELGEFLIPYIPILFLDNATFTFFSKEIVEPRFLHPNFQFRLTSEYAASNTGGRWHIDYVEIKSHNTSPQSPAALDLGFVSPPDNRFYPYTTMPWEEFHGNEFSYWNPTQPVVVRNLGEQTQNILFPDLEVRALDGSLLHYEAFANVNNQPVSPLGLNIYNQSIEYGSIALNQNPKAIITSFSMEEESPTGVVTNNSIEHTTTFQDKLSYDDGTTELILDIFSIKKEIAVKYSVYEPTTIHGVEFVVAEYENNPADNYKVRIYLDDLNSEPVIINGSSYRPHPNETVMIPLRYPIQIGADQDFYIAMSWEDCNSSNDGYCRMRLGGDLSRDHCDKIHVRDYVGTEWETFQEEFPDFPISFSPMLRPILSTELVSDAASTHFKINVNADQESCAGDLVCFDPRISPTDRTCIEDLNISLSFGGTTIDSEIVYDEATEAFRYTSPLCLDAPETAGTYNVNILVQNSCGIAFATDQVNVLPNATFYENHVVCNNTPELPTQVQSLIYPGGFVVSGQEDCGNTVIVASGTDVSFIAQEEVKLKNGFWAEPGAKFLARIGEPSYPCLISDEQMVSEEIYSDEYIPQLSITNSFLGDKLKLYPNPVTNDQLTLDVELEEPRQFLRVVLYNATGQQVGIPLTTKNLSRGNHRQVLSLSHLQAGLYLCEIQTEAGRDIQKIIKSN